MPISGIGDLDPRTLIKNPVMFVLEIVTILTTVILIRDLFTGGTSIAFEFQIILWLWFTVLFANFAEAVAEGRGKAQADALRKTRTETQAKLLAGPEAKNYKLVASTGLKVGDVVLVEAGDVVHQRPGMVHYLFDYSPDMEYLEIVGPADFGTVDAPAATDTVPGVTPWSKSAT